MGFKIDELKKTLKNTTETVVRFSEVDSMKVVWHGNYVKYLEDGREAFGRQYQLGYMDVYANKVMTPVVKLDIDYKNYVSYQEKIRIETELEFTVAAKIIFNYQIFRCSDDKLVLTAKTIQVFTDLNGDLLFTNPDFFEAWKNKWGLGK